jgi:hypothetical protein
MIEESRRSAAFTPLSPSKFHGLLFCNASKNFRDEAA